MVSQYSEAHGVLLIANYGNGNQHGQPLRVLEDGAPFASGEYPEFLLSMTVLIIRHPGLDPGSRTKNHEENVERKESPDEGSLE